MFKAKQNKGYCQNSGGHNAFSGFRGRHKKIEKTDLDTEPEGDTKPNNEIDELKQGDLPASTTELEVPEEV
jgi:hypothetical protein